MEEQQKTSMGLEPNVAGLLSYVLGWVTGLVFFFVEKDNKFVRFHAMQSILTFGSLQVLSYVVIPILRAILQAIFWRGMGAYGLYSIFSVLLGTLSWIIGLATLALWILLMVKAYQNETFKLPIVGNIAEKQTQ